MWTGRRLPKRWAAIIASQQQPQQLQMNATLRAHVLAELHQAPAARLLQQVQALGGLRAPGITMVDE